MDQHILPDIILQLTRKGGDPRGWIRNSPLCRSPSSNSSWQSLGSPAGQRCGETKAESSSEGLREQAFLGSGQQTFLSTAYKVPQDWSEHSSFLFPHCVPTLWPHGLPYSTHPRATRPLYMLVLLSKISFSHTFFCLILKVPASEKNH